MGAITAKVALYVPATYQAMVTNGDPLLFSAADLQALADLVKLKTFGVVVPESAEATTYSPTVLTFLAKLTTLQFIPAGIDYWDSRLAAEVVPTETQQFRDHLAGLQAIFEMLSGEVVADWEAIQIEMGLVKRPRALPSLSYGDNGRGILITPDPMTFPPFVGFKPGIYDLIPWKSVP